MTCLRPAVAALLIWGASLSSDSIFAADLGAAVEPSNPLLAAGLRIADRFVQENKQERNYRFDLALALGALSQT